MYLPGDCVGEEKVQRRTGVNFVRREARGVAVGIRGGSGGLWLVD